MDYKTFLTSLKASNRNFLGALTIFILTFPEISGEINRGLDASYFWALSHLAENNFKHLQELIYPYGPLGFLKSPICTGRSFLFSLIFFIIIKIWFLFKFLHYQSENKRIGLQIMLAFILGIFLSIDYYLIGLVLLYGIQYLEKSRPAPLLLMSVLAMIGLCIKSSIGINCYAVILVIIIFHARNVRSSKERIFPILTVGLVSLLLGLLIFGNISLAFRYFINIFRFATGYSSALSLPVTHNWIFLMMVLIAMLMPILYRGKKKVWQVFWLLTPVAIASWKHSMARADNSHLTIFFLFILLYWAILLVVTKIPTRVALFAMAISLCLYYSNMQNAWNFEEKTIGLSGIANFSNILLNYSDVIASCKQKSTENLKPSLLEDSIKELVGSQSIDSYPWELSFFAANPQLNWKPRRTLQSGSYARWLDTYNAEDFNKIHGPEYLIFHFVSNDQSQGLGSVDERYLLSDNPLTIYSIFNFYSPIKKTEQFVLLKKNSSQDNLSPSETSEIEILKWNDWIDFEKSNSGITRMQLFMDTSFGVQIQNMFNNSPDYFIDYLLLNGRIVSFRFNPENAADGLWLNPLILNTFSNCEINEVQKFRIRTENEIVRKIRLSYRIERINFQTNRAGHPVHQYFYLSSQNPDTLLNIEKFTTDKDVRKKDMIRIPEGLFSYTYKLELDSFWQSLPDTIQQVTVESYFSYFNKSSTGSHVIALSNSEHTFYKPLVLRQSDKLLGTYQNATLNRNSHSEGTLACYLWNNGSSTIDHSKSWLRIYTKCD